MKLLRGVQSEGRMQGTHPILERLGSNLSQEQHPDREVGDGEAPTSSSKPGLVDSEAAGLGPSLPVYLSNK